jgi:hypothetical protein
LSDFDKKEGNAHADRDFILIYRVKISHRSSSVGDAD